MPASRLPEPPWPTGLAERLEPRVTRVLAGNGSAFTFTGTQTYLVGDAAGLVVIDPGPADPAHLAALRAAIGAAPVIALACTHTHRDHSPAAAPLSRLTGAPIVGCAALATASAAALVDAPFDADYAPDLVLADGEAIAGQGWRLRAVATPGHTSNHLCYALEQDEAEAPAPALFTGDHVMGWSTSVVVPPDGDMADYLASLAKLSHREDRIYYPAHGPAVGNPRRLLRSMIGHRRARERQIIKLLGRAPQAISALVEQMYKGVPHHLWPAAGHSVQAHLIALQRRGAVGRQDDIWSVL